MRTNKMLCPIKNMTRLIYIAIISILLIGCPATFTGLIKNESDKIIVVVPPFESEKSWRINDGDSEKVNWYQECITVQDGNDIKYFSGWPIPDSVVTNGMFSSSLVAIYKDGALYFQTQEGKLVKINQVVKCSKA